MAKALVVAAIKVFFFQETDLYWKFVGEPELPRKFGFLTLNFYFMFTVIVKIGRKQISVENCKSISVKGASFRPSKRKDFRFEIKAKTFRPKIRTAR